MEDVTTETFEREGKIIMNHPAAHEYGETFVAFFGTVPYVCFHLWLLLGVGTDDCLIEENGVEPKYLLWTLMYFKLYLVSRAACKVAKCKSRTTYRKWVYIITRALASLSGFKMVLFEDRYNGDAGPFTSEFAQMVLTIDTVDFPIEEKKTRTDRKFWKGWFSKKLAGPGLKYEIGTNREGYLVWLNGPFEPSKHDVSIFDEDLAALLNDSEYSMTDGGYKGREAFVREGMLTSELKKWYHRRSRARHEAMNKRFKIFKILSSAYRGRSEQAIIDHGDIFNAIAVIIDTTCKLKLAHIWPVHVADDPDYQIH